jgi:hypothetical protein
MARVIVKNGAVAVSGGRVVTDAGGAPCCCDGFPGYPCSFLVPGSCWNIDISGVELNPNLHDLAAYGASGGGTNAPGLAECGAFFGSGSSPLNVVGVSGINKSFSARYSGGFASSFGEPGYVVFKRSTSSPPYVETDSDDGLALVQARLECGSFLNSILADNPHWGPDLFDPDKIYVSRIVVTFDGLGGFADAGPLTPFFFDAFNPRFPRPVEPGSPIPNDSECFDLSGGRRGRRGFVNGTAIVTPIGTGSQPSCPTDPTFSLAARCGNELATIPVDVETRTGDFYNCYYQGELYRLTTETTEDEPLDVEWTADECPTQPDEWPVAIECGGSGAITFDPSDRPSDGVTIQVGSTIYVPTAEISEDPPTAGAWLPDPCPDGNDIYQINFCRSSQAANQTFSFDPDTNGLQSQTVGYRPGNGLQPGEGHVFIQLPGAAGCLTQVAATPTEIPLSTEPEIVLTSRPGTCRGLPSVVVDPRSQCQQTDGGGGGTIPDSPNLTALSDSTDTGSMGLGDAVERAIKTITLNQLATCPACQRRKEVLNQFGLTVGRAVLRRLGW